jgi:hypothetical protein
LPQDDADCDGVLLSLLSVYVAWRGEAKQLAIRV